MKRMMMLIAAMLVPLPVLAQETYPELTAARAALTQCLVYAEGPAEQKEKKQESKAAAERAEKAFRAAIAAQPKDPNAYAGLGEALSRCAIPHANMTTIMSVVETSSEALQTALQLDPTHWQARFVLAMNNYNMPAFLNRTGDAIRELETLRAQQRDRNDRPYYALTYLYLGDAYKRVGRDADARTAHATGARLFPADAQLQQRVREAGGSPEAAPAQPVAASTTSTTDFTAAAPAPPTVHALAPLRVEATQHQLEDARGGTSLRRIDVYTMPGGTAEMLQTLQALPGMTRAGDGADLYVRGGEAEETPVFVNGGRLAFPGRWESLNGSTMGVLDANVLSKAYFSAGGFSAKYGNALSGVVDVESHGRPQEARWRAGANLVSAGASAYRPLSSNAGMWGTMMLTDVSLLARMNGEAETYPDMPRSYQAVIGGGINPSSTLEVKAVLLAAGDESSRLIDVGAYHGAFASDGQTQHGAISAQWLSSDNRLGLRASLTASHRSGGFEFGVLQRVRSDAAYGARTELDYVARNGMRLRSGVEISRFAGRTNGQVPLTPNLAPGSPALALAGAAENTTHVGAYAEVERELGASFVAVAGLRADQLPGEDNVSLDPRVALAYTTGDWTLRGGAGVFHQGRWRRTYRLPDGGTPTGVPTRARHVVVGAERGGEPAIRVEAYTKLYDGFAAGESGGPAIVEGTSRGLDAIVRWQRQSRLNGWLTYSLLDANVELENGNDARARYDVTHSITGVARLAVSDAWELGTTLRYGTGKPYTPIMGGMPSETEGWPMEPVYGATQSDRLPDYVRLDGRITRYQSIGGKTGVFYLEMLDLNGRRNVLGYQYDATYTVRKPMESFFARRTFVLGAELNF